MKTRCELGFDVNLKSGTVHRPIQHPGSGQFIHAEPGDESLRTPVAKGRIRFQPHPAQRPSPQAGHLGGDLDPVSAAERAARAAEQLKPKVTAAQLKAARKLLGGLLRKAGGRKRLSRIRALRMEGEAKLGQVSGAYLALALPPNHLRMELRFEGMTMVQVLEPSQGLSLKVAQK